jgi:cytochrome c oxidase cbb3-type subunit 1
VRSTAAHKFLVKPMIVTEIQSALAQTVRRHALGWLVAANVIGVGLATLLLWPAMGDLLTPLSYGRWMPLHLNWQLYGWCSLPMVGALMAWMLVPTHPAVITHAQGALAAWSMALLLGGISWLGGVTSGKLFLDWHGWARPVLPMAMGVLWTVLGAHAWWRWPYDSARDRFVRWGLLAGLLAVPAGLYWAAGREVYPSVNPHSGGATGAALLGSTLGVVALFGLLPTWLGVGRLAPERRGEPRFFWGAWVVSVGCWLAIDHGDTSHHDLAQSVGLGVLLWWVPLLTWWWKRHFWSEGAKGWLSAALLWWALLVLSGWITFLPGVSERLKFTNGLVAHAHLAMAGLVTSINVMILNQLDPTRPLRKGFGLWQGAAILHVGVLSVMGWFERDYAESFFNGATWVQIGYAVRWASGIAMTVASVQLLRETRS